MKFKIDNEEVFELNDVKKKVLCNDLMKDDLEEDMKRRVRYIIEHKYEQCMKRLKEEWMPNLKNAGLKQMPLNDDEFANLVFQQPNYKDRKAREEKAKENGEL